MRSNIITIMRKEFARFFLDRRLVITTLIMPGLLIFIMYSIIGNAALSMQSSPESDENAFSVYAVNLPASIEAAAKAGNIHFGLEYAEPEFIKQGIADKEIDALVIFPPDFDSLVDKYDPLSGKPAPGIEIYYNSSNAASAAAYEMISGVLNDYKYSISNKFDINRGDVAWDLATEKEQAVSVVASILPMLLLMLMYSGCMSIAPESIAGEKERGTIAALLVTPVRKSELAAGKIISLGVMALLCGLSSTLGILLALGNVISKAGAALNVNIYEATDFLYLLFVILSTVLLNVSLISVISAFAKSVKETGTMSMPLMFVNLLIGVSAMMSSAHEEFYYYLIPLYNSMQCMQGIFSLDFVTANIIITIIVNIAFSCAAGVMLAKMFASERIIFNK